MREARVRLRDNLSRVVHTVLSALVALGSLGCAHHAPAPVTSLEPVTAPPERLQTGTVALVMSDAAPGAHFQQPGVVGRGQGAKKGALGGALVPLVVGGLLIASYIPPLQVLGVGVALTAAPVGAAIGAAVGALAVPSNEDAEQSTAALTRALAEMRVADALVDGILEAAHSCPVIPLIVVHPDTATSVIDTFLELESPRVSLASNDPTDWKPGLRLRLTVDAKLVRAADGEALGRWSWKHEGREARLVEWGKDDARLFREELERALRAVALQAVNDLFQL